MTIPTTIHEFLHLIPHADLFSRIPRQPPPTMCRSSFVTARTYRHHLTLHISPPAVCYAFNSSQPLRPVPPRVPPREARGLCITEVTTCMPMEGSSWPAYDVGGKGSRSQAHGTSSAKRRLYTTHTRAPR